MRLLPIFVALGIMAACRSPQSASKPQPVPASTSAQPFPAPSAPPAAAPAAEATSVSTAAAAAVPQIPCFNTKYKFTCAIPDGFVMTDEGDGPGMIMTMVQRSIRSDAQAELTVSAHHLNSKTSVEKYIETHSVQELKAAKGVLQLTASTATYAAQDGYEVKVERQFASGDFRSVIFGFAVRPNIFIINYSAPSDFFDRKPDIGNRFVQSMQFQTANGAR